MKAAETCTCGASIDIEDDDPEAVRAEIREWRRTHLCGGVQPWRPSERSTTASSIEIGFQQREGQVTA